MIAILGTGLLGTGFARALHAKGHAVTVWNRTAERARPLAAEGITVADSAEAAVRGADRVHVVVSDDAAVDATLAAAAPGLAPNTLVFDHSTTSANGAVDRTAAWRARGITYLHAPVFMGPQNAREATGLMLISGDPAVLATARPILAPMTGKLVELGPRVDAAAGYKLLGNLLLVAITAGFTDMLALAKSLNLGAPDIAALLGEFNPGASLPQRFARLASGDYANPSWELAMARKDVRLMQDAVGRSQIDFTFVDAFAAHMDRTIAGGHAHEDWTVVAKDVLR